LTNQAETKDIPVLRIWAALLILTALLMGPLTIFMLGAVCFAGLLILWFKSDWCRRDTTYLLQGFMLMLCVIWFVFNIVVEFYSNGRMIGWLFVIAMIFPPLIAHLYYLEVADMIGRKSRWEIFIGLIYVTSFSVSLWIAIMAAGYLGTGPVDNGINLMMILSALFILTGIFCAGFFSQVPKSRKREKLAWRRSSLNLLVAMIAIFALIIAANLGWIPNMSGFLATLSRSMPLFFLFVNTYYEARFEFFDVFVKRATLFFLALVFVRLYFEIAPGYIDRLDVDKGTRSWIYSLTLIPVVILAPWVYRKAGALLDKFWLGRIFTPVDAIKFFLEGVQQVTSAEELARKAENRISQIFQAPVRIRLKGNPVGIDDELPVVQEIPIPPHGESTGVLLLGSRRNHTPYFADDMTLLAALSEVIAYLLQNLNLQKRKQEQEIREQELILDASRSELKALRAQINPHFLFNALNAIASLTQKDPDRAESTVEQLAEVFRYTLSRSDQEWVRIEDEIEFIRAYLEVEKARFGDRLQVEIRCDETIVDREIPTMMLQTLVENAVKHGVSAVKGPGRIGISVHSRGGYLHLEVTDNGPGPNLRKHKSTYRKIKKITQYGLKNIHNRLEGYFGSEAEITLERAEEGITRARIMMPMGLLSEKEVPGSSSRGAS